ncbi:hypothetical protein VCRA2119O147_400006 [Vibrio crassostreae]|uniref:Uncharacterized protein n=1 Tax=Vibrio crassostreae TaxID=246167 RepID=A0ABP1WTY6_9VIBR|nr:hypothetical protein VCRA2113O207_110032 [Vibrio crassostreae]CAK1714186.1 hypothetical protein VCRA2112O184_110033 [Vibrio crassostreae]CAK1723374.1 hypothetical protein VCRA2113O227_110122 [Vibrio crassostreae]CAK1723798.1 hypothetical protein VCRA2112O188_110126 [Vibrio crassostreae]CAK1724789.1 hypothetical protein VCRA2118O144_110122 [Vibrio crassostreae]
MKLSDGLNGREQTQRLVFDIESKLIRLLKERIVCQTCFV